MPLLTPGRIFIIFIVLKMPAEKMHAHPRNFFCWHGDFAKSVHNVNIYLKKVLLLLISSTYKFF